MFVLVYWVRFGSFFSFLKFLASMLYTCFSMCRSQLAHCSSIYVCLHEVLHADAHSYS